jgi:hypothetical protein
MHFSFDPLDPFPLLLNLEGTYEAAKLHSARADDFLGFRIFETEARLVNDRIPWAGLAPATLLTPYTELRFLLNRIAPEPGFRLIELGSGYSRLAHVLQRHHCGARYQGFEMVAQRAAEAVRVLEARGVQNASVECGDLLCRKSFPEGDCYFLYDLSADWEDTENVLTRIGEVARTRRILVIGRGLATRTWIERKHPWLSQVNPPEYHGNFTMYRS